MYSKLPFFPGVPSLSPSGGGRGPAPQCRNLGRLALNGPDRMGCGPLLSASLPVLPGRNYWLALKRRPRRAALPCRSCLQWPPDRMDRGPCRRFPYILCPMRSCSQGMRSPRRGFLSGLALDRADRMGAVPTARNRSGLAGRRFHVWFAAALNRRA